MNTKIRLLELTSDVVFKAFMMSENTKSYKARLIHLTTGIDENDLEQIIDKNTIGLYDAEKIERKVRNTQIKGSKLEGIEQGKKEEKNPDRQKFEKFWYVTGGYIQNDISFS